MMRALAIYCGGWASRNEQATNFNDAKSERIWKFDLSRDGKQLVIARGGQNADVVLISEVK